VHAALAAAMSNPALLESWRNNPAALQTIGIDGRQTDLEQIRNFIGLVTKVRHNDLRTTLPLTFTLLDRAGLSIPFFADYADKAAALRAAGRLTPAAKNEALQTGLGAWLDLANPVHALIWDMLRHEQSIQSLRQDGRPMSPCLPAGKLGSGTILRHNGSVFHHELSCHPSDVEAVMQRRESRLEDIPRQRSLYAYFADRQSGRIRISDVDEITFVMLDLADGTSSIGDMAASLRGAGVKLQTRQLAGLAGELIESGMLVPCESGSHARRPGR
jgi:hypothetical protein